jgi:predicted nucleic acid-binding protein
VIYLDTSVAVAHLLAEDRQPPAKLWQELLVSSRLLQYELWTSIHRRQLAQTHADAARALLGQIAFLEMVPEVLGRALEPFPVEVRTLDALHLASLHFLHSQGQPAALATYDARLTEAARRLDFEVYELDS